MVTEAAKENVKEALPLTVLYDGACPLCRREIGVYRGLQPLQPDAPVCFADVSDAALPMPPLAPVMRTIAVMVCSKAVKGSRSVGVSRAGVADIGKTHRRIEFQWLQAAVDADLAAAQRARAVVQHGQRRCLVDEFIHSLGHHAGTSLTASRSTAESSPREVRLHHCEKESQRRSTRGKSASAGSHSAQ